MQLKNKRILITGGAGFIGAALAKRLYQKNSEIIILDNFSTGRLENLSDIKFQSITGEITDYSNLPKIHDIDYILHFAAPSSVILFDKDADKCIKDTILGLRNIFEFAKKNQVKKIVFPSSSSVYGNTPLPQTENTPTNPVNLYGVAKLACESISRLYSDTVPSVALRIFAGYGPGEFHKGPIASIVTLFYESMTQNSKPIVFGDGTQTRDFVYIDDIVKAAITSLSTEITGPINVGSGESHTFTEIVDLLNKFLGTNLTPQYVKKPMKYFEHTLADTSRMKKAFDFTPTTFEKGLQNLIKTRQGVKQ